MERKEWGNGPWPEDVRRELGRCGVGNALFHNELHAYKRMFNEDEKMDESYKILLLCLFMQEKQFVVPQTKKQNGKLDEPLLPILRSNRSEQLLRRGQGLNGEDNDVREDAGTELKDVCENVGPGLKEGVEMPNKRKGKGLLIHYIDVNIHGVVEKNQNRKDHVIEHEDDVREDSEQTLRVCLVDRENGVKAFELEKKRKGEDLFTEHDDQLLRANSVKSLTEMFEPREKQNEKAPQEERSDDQLLRANSVKPMTRRFEPREKQNEKALQEERSEPPLIIKQKDTDDTKLEDDYGYKLFLKLMDEYKQAKNEALHDNEATVKNEEGVGSNKDNEPEPKRKSTTTMKSNVELPIQVPSPFKRSNIGNLTNDESEKAEIEKCSARKSRKSILEESSDKGEDENMEIRKRLSRRSGKVVHKEPSDEDEREEIEKHPSCEVGKKRKGEKVKADIEKCSSRRLRKVNYKEPSNKDMGDDGGEDIEKRPSHKIGNVFMKNSKDKNEKADIEKCSSRRSRKIAYNYLLSNEDERETKKLPSREVRNVAMKKPKNENVEADVKKNSCRRSRKLILEESSDEDPEIEKHSSREVRNVVMKKSKNKKAAAEIEKHPSHRSKKVFYKEHSSGKDEDEREEIEKRSSREIRNVVMKKPKNEKAEAEMKKHPSHRLKKVFYKEHSSCKDEDEREEIENRSSLEVRNSVVKKKSKKAQAEIEKLLSRRSKEVFYQDYSSNDDREEIEKRSSRKVRNNVVVKKSKKAEAEIEKLPFRRSREVFNEDYSSNENSDVKIKKHASRRLWKAILEELSDKEKDVYMEMEKRSSREVRNVAMKKHKNEKVKDEIEKRSSHQSRKVCSPNESTNETEILLAERKARDDRKVAMKRLRDEDIEEKIERLRNYLLKRSRYGIEGRTSHNFMVGESSAHPKKTDKDSLEDEESSDDDSELEILDKDECLNGPFMTAKSYIDLDDDCYKSSEECMEFRGKVLEVISKPYEKSEYNALYAEFREQCYAAHHPDLVDKLKMNRWRPRKRLAILRGYFFWLQNLTQKGSFRPWNDIVCLDVEPEWPLQTRQTPGKRLGK